MTIVRRALALCAVGVAGFVGFTWWALESSEVAVLTTKSASGERSTHVWFVESGGELLVEAGTPDNGWFQDVQTSPELRFSAGPRSGTYRAKPLPNPAGHRRIRALLREKYGVRDQWIGLIFDTSKSVAVRLR